MKFAAPFVLVVGCGGEPAHHHHHPKRIAPVEASEPPDAAVPETGCHTIEIACEGAECETAIIDGATIYEGPITAIRGDGQDSVAVEVKPPNEVPVAEWWKGVFLAPDGAPIVGSEFDVIAAGKGIAYGSIAGCEPPAKRVRLWAPDSGPPKPHKHAPCCTNPPAPPPTPSRVEARIIAVTVDSGYTLVTLTAGTNDGVERSWHVTLGTMKIECQIVRVQDKTTICRVTATDITATTAILTK